MVPKKFEGANAVYGANQPEYIPLPAEKEQKPAEWSAKGRRGRIGSTPEHIRKKAENFLSKMEPPYDADDTPKQEVI